MATEIKILGTGCAKCQQLYDNTEAAAKALNIEYTMEKVTGISDIMDHGVMITPALVVNGEVKLAGKAADADEIKALLT